MQKQSTLDQFEAASCFGKVKYENNRLAQEAVARTQKRKKLRGSKKRKRGVSMAPYLCKFCGGWHIGH